jgi:PAS domain S-box-containing protein
MMNTADFFSGIFNNARQSAMIIMSNKGIIKQVNEAFSNAYGYTTEDLQSKHFHLLYIEKDKVTLKPEIELNIVMREGCSSDNNYLVHKDGTPIWVSGESILVKTEEFECVVKIIHNIHAQKQLERYLLDGNEMLESLFESVQSALLILDSQMRTVKTNSMFRKMFNLTEPLTEGSKLQDVPHKFWSDEELRSDIRNALVHGHRINKDYILGNDKNDFIKIHITSKLMLGESTHEKGILLVMKGEK